MQFSLKDPPGPGLNGAEIEHIVGNQYNRLLRQQQDSEALSASKGSTTSDRDKGKDWRPRNKFEGNRFNCGKKGPPRWVIEEREEKGKFRRCREEEYYVCGSEEHPTHKHCGLCKSLEHRARECEE